MSDKNAKNDDIIIRGTISRVTFHNPENGYCVLQIDANSLGPITLVGFYLNLNSGQNIVGRGQFIQHPKFGRQFQANSITISAPTSPDEIERFLASGLIKGVGDVTAALIVKKYGEDTLDLIEHDPSLIAKIKGVGPHKAQLLQAALIEHSSSRECIRFLVEHGIPTSTAQKIFRVYGVKTIELISSDPYRLSRDIAGIGFLTADSIALKLGIKYDSPQRLRAGIMHALDKAADDGHCFLSENILIERTRALLGVDETMDLSEHTYFLEQDQRIIRREDCLALPYLDRAEENVARFIASRISPFSEPVISEGFAQQALSRAADELNLTFSPEQELAVKSAVKFPLMIVTGGPGCGKTTIIKALSKLFQIANKKLYLAAPTGRAAQRMSDVCGMPASTIHRLLKYDPINRQFLYGLDNKLHGDCLILDESSMIDIQLAQFLFAAIPSGMSVIMVGDKDQLPSVGPGKLLGDLLSIPEIPCISLTRLFRRDSESTINDIAHMINSGNVPDIPSPDGVTKADAYFIPKKEPEEIVSIVESLVSDQLPKKFGFAQNEITVLTPSNRGPLGTINLNNRLQEKLNPSGMIDSEQEVSFGDMTFRIGDRVCQRVNNYNIIEGGVFNGDPGVITSINPQNKEVTVELWDGRLVRYSKIDLQQLSLSYSITVHRAQGSEISCVVLVLHDSQFTLLERQLLYTAVTRAKKLLIVVGSRRALHTASKRATTRLRSTSIKKRIADLIV